MSQPPPIGVLLVQLGTPEAPTPRAVRRYLAEFLSDRRVVDRPGWLWKPILHALVLRTRPRHVARLYERIWEPGGSPLATHTTALAERLQDALGSSYTVARGMRIGSPPLADALDDLANAGHERVVVLPLFPQTSSATTLSVLDGVAAWARRRKNVPALSFVRCFADHPRYIRALADSVRAAGARPDPSCPLLLSYHGLPARFVREDDPYQQHCEATTRALLGALDLTTESCRVVYQSRFGKEPWLEPYALDALRRLPSAGIRNLWVLTPSFLADCLETIDEMGRLSRDVFLNAGGESYTRIPCLNATPGAVETLVEVLHSALASAPCTAGVGCGCESRCLGRGRRLADP